MTKRQNIKKTMKNSAKKYHDLLDKLAETIRKGDHKKVEKIKDKIEQIEHQIYLKKLKEKQNNGK